MGRENWFEVEDVKIWGGAGSVAANTEDLERAAEQLGQVQEFLGNARLLLQEALCGLEFQWNQVFLWPMLRVSFSMPSSPAVPTDQQRFLYSSLTLLTGEVRQALLDLHKDCGALGAAVFKSAQDYSRAEDQASSFGASLMDTFNDMPMFLYGPNFALGFSQRLFAGTRNRDARSAKEKMVSGFASVLNPFGGLAGDNDLQAVANQTQPFLESLHSLSLKVRGIVPTEWQLEPSQLAEHPVKTPGAQNISEVVDTVVDNRETHDGQIMVQQQNAPDGTKSWVIYVPGTQDWWLNGQNHPIDASGNLDLITGKPTALPLEYLRAAMEQAGISPDEPVTLIGHSQGGIAVQQAQTDPWFQQNVNLKGVVTVSSPVSLHASNKDVNTLHIENDRDFVPVLDARSNPDSLKRVTVHATISGGGAKHNVEQNMAILDAPMVKEDPSVQKILKDINANVGVAAGGTIVTTFYEAKKTV